ncbi:MAG: ParA family protein [Hyphomicrobium sp.]|jgi:chromosome partitioning protein
MHVIAVASSKGGVGKTTLSSALAVRAARDSERVAMVDLDPQGSLAGWWKRRGGSQDPCIFAGSDTASSAVEALALDGWDWVFLDTPPAFVATIQDAITSAHLALIPLRASALDLIASEDAVIMARDAGIPHLCVINDAEPAWKTTSAAREYLRAASVPVAETIVAHRAAYVAAVTSGKSGPEVEKPDRKGELACSREIDALWIEIKAALASGKGAGRG